jgi:hypothetical protein
MGMADEPLDIGDWIARIMAGTKVGSSNVDGIRAMIDCGYPNGRGFSG